MQRKWTVLAVALVSCLALVAGMSANGEEKETKLGKIMEQVTSKNGMITKAVRNKVNFTKGQKDVVKHAEELIKLAEEAKPIKDDVKKAKAAGNKEATDANWDKLMDEFIKTTKDLKAVAAKEGTTFTEAKTAHAAVKKSCTACHTIFRPEED